MVARSIIQGDAALQAALRNIPVKTNRGLDTVVAQSMEPMRARTEANALRLRQPGKQPKGGHLDQGIVIKKVAASGTTSRTFWLAFAKRARYIAHLVEFGSRPHEILPKKASLLHFLWKGQEIFATRVRHGGAKRTPFAVPAFESTKGEVVNEVGRRTWALIRGSVLSGIR